MMQNTREVVSFDSDKSILWRKAPHHMTLMLMIDQPQQRGLSVGLVTKCRVGYWWYTASIQSEVLESAGEVIVWTIAVLGKVSCNFTKRQNHFVTF